MRVLVATRRGQGDRPGDYCFATEGEPVTPFPPPCTMPGRCGCQRGFDGLESDRSTTTAMVADVPTLDLDQLTALLAAAIRRSGHIADDEIESVALDHLDAIRRIVGSLPSGTLVRRDGAGCVADLGGAA